MAAKFQSFSTGAMMESHAEYYYGLILPDLVPDINTTSLVFSTWTITALQ